MNENETQNKALQKLEEKYTLDRHNVWKNKFAFYNENIIPILILFFWFGSCSLTYEFYLVFKVITGKYIFQNNDVIIMIMSILSILPYLFYLLDDFLFKKETKKQLIFLNKTLDDYYIQKLIDQKNSNESDIVVINKALDIWVEKMYEMYDGQIKQLFDSKIAKHVFNYNRQYQNITKQILEDKENEIAYKKNQQVIRDKARHLLDNFENK